MHKENIFRSDQFSCQFEVNLKLTNVPFSVGHSLPMLVCATQVTGRADNQENERDEDEKVHLGSLPVVSRSFSLVESSPSSLQDVVSSQKRRKQTMTETEMSSADSLSSLRDEDEMFLLSLLPSLKRLTIKKRMEVRMKFQQVLYAAEFED